RRHEVLHGSRDVLDGNVGVHPVLVVEIDDVDAEPPEGSVGGLPDVLGSAGQTGLASLVVEGEPELGRDDDPIANRGQRLPHELLVHERPVDLGRIEERDPTVHGGTDQIDHVLATARVRAIALAHPHTAQPDRGDHEIGPECALAHGGFLLFAYVTYEDVTYPGAGTFTTRDGHSQERSGSAAVEAWMSAVA